MQARLLLKDCMEKGIFGEVRTSWVDDTHSAEEWINDITQCEIKSVSGNIEDDEEYLVLIIGENDENPFPYQPEFTAIGYEGHSKAVILGFIIEDL